MILTFDGIGWFNGIMRPFLAAIDKVIYSLIGWIVEGIFNLSSLMVEGNLVQTIYNRIYVVLALFMVFKLTFSFIKYLISPDIMTDKEQGVGKLIARTVVMLAIVVLLPIIFFSTELEGMNGRPILTVLQEGVLNTIPKIILGIENDDTGSNSVKEQAKTNGEEMASLMLSSFYYDSSCEKDESTCDRDSNNVSLDKFSSSILEEGTDGDYKYQYMWPLTTIAGILLVVILLGIAIDIAIRTFKLMILQVMAPIPVMSYIDPKSSKDGAFNSWLKSFISTYLDIFVKIGTVYLLLLLVGETFSGGLFGDQFNSYGFMSKNFLYAFLIIGLFKFAKDAPKFIKDAMGIKDNGGGGGFMGKALSGMAGAAAGFAGGLATGGLAGGLSGIATGYSSGLAGKAGQAFSQVRDEQAKLLGKTPGGMRGKLQNKAMQRSVMKHTGLNRDSLKAAKMDMIKKQNLASELAANYQQFGDAFYTDKNGNRQYLKDEYGNDITGYAAINEAQKSAAKAQSNYNDANSLAGQIGLKPNFFQENKRHGAAYRAVNRAISGKGKIDNLSNVDLEYVSDKVEGSYYNRHYNNSDDVISSKHVYQEAKADYKRAAGGGFGKISDSGDAPNVKDARDRMKTAKTDFKDIKEINKK